MKKGAKIEHTSHAQKIIAKKGSNQRTSFILGNVYVAGIWIWSKVLHDK